MNNYKLAQVEHAVCYILLSLLTPLLANMNIYAQWSGTGTSSDPYLINNVADLTTLATNVNNGVSTYSGKFFWLTSGLNLNGNAWTPIGTPARTFQGNFNGNNHIISGLTINLSSTDNVGLFGYATNATIRNLGVETNLGTVTGHNNVGIMLGSQNGGVITNCYVAGYVSGNDVVGGLVGNMVATSGSGSINTCYAFSFVTCTATNSNGIGGLVGIQRGNITNSYTFGSVQGNGPTGGLAGTASNLAVLSNSYSTSSVTASSGSRVGGLTGNQSQNTALLKNTVAINGSVNGPTTATGRVSGFRNTASSTVNNYAWGEMPITINNISKTISPNANDIDGASQTLDNLKSYAFYSTTASWGSAINDGNSGSYIWNIWDGNSYPYLQEQSSPVNEVTIWGTILQGTFRPEAVMDSISVYLKTDTTLTRFGTANVDNTSHIWTYNDPALAVNGVLYIIAYETGKNWPSYPVSLVICGSSPTFDVVDTVLCAPPINLQTCIKNLQNAGINDVQFSTADEETFDAHIITSPTTYSVHGVQTIYVKATNSLGCRSSIRSFQVRQIGSLLFREDFGNAGTSGGDCSTTPLPGSVTTYTFGGDLHINGRYGMCSQMSSFYSDYFYFGSTSYDHSNPGKGRSLIVNADFEPGKFYTLTMNNLCPGTLLSFSAWVFNLVDPNAPNTSFYMNQGVVFNDPDLLFVLTDENNAVLAQYNTGIIPKVTNPATNWRPYGFEFVTGLSSSVTLTLYNNAPGGNGNDLMIDDIEVYLCTPSVVIEGPLSYCPGDPLNLTVKNDDGTPLNNGVKVNWLFSENGNMGPGAKWDTITTSGTSGHLDIPFQKTGYLRAVAGSPEAIDSKLYNCCSMSVPTLITVTPGLMYWNKNVTNNNWNNPDNWVDANGVLLNNVPGPCTDVHIPGNANYYPSLDSISTERTSIYGNPVCRNIYFHFGAEVAKPHYLNYSKAYVLYNFGYFDANNTFRTDGDPYSAIPMNRGRWYALAAPLKKIVSGDFSVGGFPNMWQRGFKSSPDHSTTLSGDWYIPENTVALEIGARQNYAISVWGGEYLPGVLGENDHTNLNALKGILQMPYFEDAAINEKHRIHTYLLPDSVSRFFYYYYDRPGLPIEPNKYDDFSRASESYRFVFEDNNRNPMNDFTFSVPAGTDIMIGNPFISSLDFQDFYNHNSAVIENYYRLFTNNNFDTYSLETGSSTGLTNYIASFQGFFVTTKGSGMVNLHFPISSSVTRPGYTNHEFKSAGSNIYDILRINVTSKIGNSQATLALNPQKQDSDVQQLFIVNAGSKNVPQIYLLDSTKSKNVIQHAYGNKIEVPIGIMIESPDSMILSVDISEGSNYDSIVLIDTWLKTQVDILKKNIYSFKNESGTGERFLLRILYPDILTGIPSINDKKNIINAFIKNGILEVYASKKISGVEVFTLQGISLLYNENIESNHFIWPVDTPPGVYIIKVTLENNNVETLKVISY